MRIFILPSWCPTVDEPMSGTFFVEQADAIAQLRPEWTVAICRFDLARSRVPWRPWNIPRFLKDWLNTSRLIVHMTPSGLYEYNVWVPFLPQFGRQSKWTATTKGLSSQARIALENFIQKFGKPDFIHAHAAYPGGAAAVSLGKEFSIPVGITEHLGPFPPPKLCLPDGHVLPIIARAYDGALLHSAVSKSLADRIIALGLADKVEVIPNFLPDDFGAGLANVPIKRDGFTFLSVGGPSREKGTDLLLNALAKIDEKATLSIVGSSPELPFFQKMALDLGIADRVCWLGKTSREKMPHLYQKCNAFVLPSRGETFGIAFIEALAFGKPLIATRCGGPEDIVHAGNGLLVPLDSIEDLALAMNQMIEQSGTYAPKALRSEFLSRFSASAVVERIEEWYLALKNTGQRKTGN